MEEFVNENTTENLPEEKIEIIEENEEKENLEVNKEKHKTKTPLCRIIIDALLFVLIIVLFVLHFTGKEKKETPFVATHQEMTGTGEIVYVNIDTINAHYELVSILTNDIEAEQKRQETIFANRQKAFEAKYNQFQKNYQADILTPIQIQNAQEQLMQESETLQYEYEQVSMNLQNRQVAALQQIADSLFKAVERINAERNASFIFSYQYGGNLLMADPGKDITDDVLRELNKTYKK